MQGAGLKRCCQGFRTSRTLEVWLGSEFSKGCYLLRSEESDSAKHCVHPKNVCFSMARLPDFSLAFSLASLKAK